MKQYAPLALVPKPWRDVSLAATMKLVIAVLALASCSSAPEEQPPPDTTQEVVQLWPGAAPGTESWTGPEVNRIDTGSLGEIQITTHVTVPTMTVVRPAPGKANGTAMLVLPGGAFAALAWDLEGTEVARWLADRGITAFVLKYRVRPFTPTPGQESPPDLTEILLQVEARRQIAIADATQAVRILRQDAANHGINPDRIGMIGFSAGAITTMGVLLENDAAVRPNFAASIYGMSMTAAPQVPADAPPLLLVAAQDDVSMATGSTQIFGLWTEANRSAELHLYEKGGHGFGMRPQGLPVDHWPAVLEAWLDAHGLLSNAASTR
jgi:dienelactone hydrolase